MPADSDPRPPGKGGMPLWLILAGGAAVAVFLYVRHRSNAASSQLNSAGLGTTGVVTDPNTGLPVDPLTGLPYISGGGSQQSGQTLAQWAASAEQVLVQNGISPALAGKAIYDYTSSNQLDSQEANAINIALGKIGFPPITLPFLGTVPTTGPTTTPPPVPTNGGTQTLSPIAAFPIKLPKGERIVDVVRAPQFGKSAGYYLTNFGGVFAVGGAPFLGSGVQPGHKLGQFTDLLLNSNGGYTLVGTGGSRYTFNPRKKAA